MFKMKKFSLFHVVIVGAFLLFNVYGTLCCRHAGRLTHTRKCFNALNDREKRGSILLVPYKSKSPNYENTDAAKLREIEKLINEKFEENDVITENTPENATTENSEEYERTTNTTVEKDIDDGHNSRKKRKDIEDVNPVEIVIGQKLLIPDKSKRKRYMCYCKEIDCQHECNEEKSSNEESDEPLMSASSSKMEYTRSVTQYPSLTTYPTKINIPLFNNINYDQRVVIGSKKPYRIHPQLYDNPTYQNQEDYVSNAFGKSNPEKCVKLYGRTVCPMSPPSEQSIGKYETIDLTDDDTIKVYQGIESNDGAESYPLMTESPIRFTQSLYNPSPVTQKTFTYVPRYGTNVKPNYYTNNEYIETTPPAYKMENDYKIESQNFPQTTPVPEAVTYRTNVNNNFNYVYNTNEQVESSTIPNYYSKETVKINNFRDASEYSTRKFQVTTMPPIEPIKNSYYTNENKEEALKHDDTNHHLPINTDYVPIYSSKEMTNQFQPNTEPTTGPIQYIHQVRDVYDRNVPNYNSRELINSNEQIPKPTFTYSNDHYTTYNNVNNLKLVIAQPVNGFNNYDNKNVVNDKLLQLYPTGSDYDNDDHKTTIPMTTDTTPIYAKSDNFNLVTPPPPSLQSANYYENNERKQWEHDAIRETTTYNPNAYTNNNIETIKYNDFYKSESYEDKISSIHTTLPPKVYTTLPTSDARKLSKDKYNSKSIVSSKEESEAKSSHRESTKKVCSKCAGKNKNKENSKSSTVLSQSKKETNSYSVERAKQSQSVTTLEDVEDKRRYDNNDDPQKPPVMRAINKSNLQATQDKHSNEFVQALHVTEGRNQNQFNKYNDTDALFRGLEKTILEHDYIPDKPMKINDIKMKSNKNTPKPSGRPQSTESSIQTVDDRPALSSEESKNEMILENTLKKVLNNFVPGRAQDLLANYGNVKSTELVGANIEELRPEIVNTPILRNLFSLPEIENLITDTASNFLTRVTGLPIIGDIPHLIRDTLHSVIDQIPRPHPTVAPMTDDDTPGVPVTVEEHRIQDGEWITERVPLLQKSQTRPPKEVVERIQSILDRSGIEDQSASQPIVQNFIVKAVKHSLDKERDIIDEYTIRQAFDLIVPQRSQNKSNLKNPLTIQSTSSSNDDNDYKIAPRISVTEHVLRGGQWYESQRNLVGKKPNEKVGYDETSKQSLEQKLNKLQVTKTKSENKTVTVNRKQTYSSANVKEKSSRSKTVGSKSSKTATSLEEKIKEPIVRTPINYYSSNDRIFDYVNNHRVTENPGVTIADHDYVEAANPTTTVNYRTPKGIENSRNTYKKNQRTESRVIQQKKLQETNVRKSNNDKLNLLLDPEIDSPNYQRNENLKSQGKTEATRQISYPSDNSGFLGRLVPVAKDANDLTDLQDSDLIYVGDGVKLPLTMRKMNDGSFALTLSDEVCKQFVHKKCPCCLPNGNNGKIVRGRRNEEIIAQLHDIGDEIPTTPSADYPYDYTEVYEEETEEKMKSKINDDPEQPDDYNHHPTNNVNVKNYMFQPEDDKFDDVEYEEYEEASPGAKFNYQKNNPIVSKLREVQDILNTRTNGPPYRYQRYANEDATVSGKTEAIKTMLHWMKELVKTDSRKR